MAVPVAAAGVGVGLCGTEVAVGLGVLVAAPMVGVMPLVVEVAVGADLSDPDEHATAIAMITSANESNAYLNGTRNSGLRDE